MSEKQKTVRLGGGEKPLGHSICVIIYDNEKSSLSGELEMKVSLFRNELIIRQYS